jgi:hypothetical protein
LWNYGFKGSIGDEYFLILHPSDDDKLIQQTAGGTAKAVRDFYRHEREARSVGIRKPLGKV